MYGREQASRAYITGESIEEDDIVKSRVGNSLRQERQTNKGGRAASPRDLIRRC